MELFYFRMAPALYPRGGKRENSIAGHTFLFTFHQNTMEILLKGVIMLRHSGFV